MEALLLAGPAGVAGFDAHASTTLGAAGLGPQIAFWALALIVVGGAIVTITRRNAIMAVMALVGTFFGLAGMYLLLSAQFLSALQVLVYAGAIMTLFVFVVMVLNREEAEPWALRGIVTKAIGVGAVSYFVIKAAAFLFRDVPSRAQLPPEEFGGVSNVGDLLFTRYLFPFEALSLMLLIAVIGAVVVARTMKSHTETDHGGGLAHDALASTGAGASIGATASTGASASIGVTASNDATASNTGATGRREGH